MRFWFRAKPRQPPKPPPLSTRDLLWIVYNKLERLEETNMAISDQLTALNQNLADLKASVDAAVAALQAAANVPAGLEQTLADANTAISGATASLKAATPTA